MDLKLTYDQEFDDLYMHLRSKYPQELFDLDGIGKQLDMHRFAQDFYSEGASTTADVSVDANANVAARDVITYNFEMPKPFHKINSYFLLWKELRKKHGLETANRIIEMQLTGDIYINDAWDIGRPYCFNFSTYDIALNGLPMGDRVKPVPPKSLFSFIRQVEQFTVYAANSTLGATGLADLLIVMAHYVDKLFTSIGEPRYKFSGTHSSWSYVREAVSSLVYTLNWQFRGNQSPFTNISLYDREFLNELVPEYRFMDGTTPRIETVQWLQQVFMDVMNEELRRAPLTFPVTTACFAVDEEGNLKDEAFARTVASANREFGFINIYCGKSSTLSSCCRLRSDTKGDYFNSFGSGSTKIGSLGVVTINLPRLAERFRGEAEFLDALAGLVWVAGAINAAKREIIRKRVKRGNLPLYTLGHMDLRRQYSTCGLTGISEAVEYLGQDILEEGGQQLVLRLLDVINGTNEELAQDLGYPHNCEQVPAESSSVKLASKDTLMGFNREGIPYYSNQFIPLTAQADMLDRIRLQGMFDRHFSGGAICHLNVSERIEDHEQIVDLIKLCAKQGVVYWAINYALAKCPNGCGGMEVVGGAQHLAPPCPKCGTPMDTFTRVVGFLTNTKHWNKVRRHSDWPNRQFYKEI